MKYKNKISLLSLAMASIVLVSMVAAAGVTAAQTVNVNGQVAVVYAGGHQYLFAQGANGNLYYKETSSPTWINLGGPIGSAPAAVRQPSLANPNQVTIFVRGTNGDLYSATTTDITAATPVWGTLTIMSGTVAAGTGPVAVYNAANPAGAQTDVFFVDSATHQLMEDSSAIPSGIFPPTGGSTPLGGYVTATPGAVVTSAGTGGIDVFVRGSQGALYEREYATGGWSGWTKFHDGTLEAGTGPTAVSDGFVGGSLATGTGQTAVPDGYGDMTVYVTGTNLHMYSVYSGDDGLTWNHHFSGALSWTNLGGTLTSSPSGTHLSSPTADLSRPPTPDYVVVVRGADNNIWTNVNGIWQTPPPITAP
jgi:hypothetical protein